MRTYQEGDNVENHRVRAHRMMLASFFILLSQQIQPRSKASLQNMRANVARRFATLTCLQSVRLFSQNFTSYQIKIILRCFRRDIPGMPISAKQTRVYGGGVRGMTVPIGIGLKFIQTPVKPPQRIVIFARNFFDIYYLLQYKKLQRALEAVCAGSNSL